MIIVRNDSSSSGALTRAEQKSEFETMSKGAASQFDSALAAHERSALDGKAEDASKEDAPELVGLPVSNSSMLIAAQGLAALTALFSQPVHMLQAARSPEANEGAIVKSLLAQSGQEALKIISDLKGTMPHKGESDALDHLPDGLSEPKAMLMAQTHSGAGVAGADKKSTYDDLPLIPIQEIHTTNHFAPVQLDPIRQITNSVVQALEGPDAAASTPASSQMADSPIKTLQVKLEPENLGSVTLRMRLSGNQLSLRVDVAESSTLQMIRNEQDRLHKSLARDDVQVEKLEIRAAASVSDLAPIAKSEETARYGVGSGSGGDGQSSALPQGQQQRAKGEGPRRFIQEKNTTDEASSLAPSGALSRGLYL
jgi:hypothetical protein